MWEAKPVSPSRRDKKKFGGEKNSLLRQGILSPKAYFKRDDACFQIHLDDPTCSIGRNQFPSTSQFYFWFKQGIVEKSIKNLKNEKKEAKELSRIEEGASSSVHTKDALRNEEQKKDTYIMGKIEMYCSGLIEANDLVLDDSLNEDWSILFD